MTRRILGLFGLLAVCAALFISATGAGAQGNGGDYDYYGNEDDYYATTTEAPATTTTVAETTTTVEETTTTVAPTTIVTEVPQVLATQADPAVAAAVEELAFTGVGSAGLAAIGCGAIALGLFARRAARTER